MTHCRLAINPTGHILLAWRQDGEILSRTWVAGSLTPIEHHGTGSDPSAAWAEGNFWLAWASPEGIWVRSGNGETWEASELLIAQSDPSLHWPSLYGSTAPDWTDHQLDLTYSDTNGRIWNRHHPDGHWHHTSYQEAWAHADYGTVPRSCRADGNLFYSDIFGVYWFMGAIGEEDYDSPAVAFGAVMDTAAGSLVHVVATGRQPVCPCNQIYYTQGPTIWDPNDPLGYTPLEDLTVNAEIHSWPREPVLVGDSANTLHAVWYQRHADQEMHFLYNTVIYQTRENGVWVNRTDLLQGYALDSVDPCVALAPDERPVFAFAKEGACEFTVWLGLDRPQTSVPETPAAASRLSAYPNPFNPKTQIRFEDYSGPLAVTVHDLAGRQLRTLYEGTSDGVVVLDWDGRDGEGRELPSGIYLLYARGGRDHASMKLLIVR